jgi:transposase
VLAALEGRGNGQIAAELKLSRPTVGLWRQRFIDLRLPGLADLPKPGRESKLDPQRVRRVLTEVVRPPEGRKRWSCRSMARHAGLSKATVQRLWRANDLKPHLTRTFKLSNDKEFERKFWDVIGLYLLPPLRSLILCCDEKSQCQALERSQPGLPLGQGHIQTRTHDYYRHGTVTLFAALNYLSGKVIALTKPRHRHQEWLEYLRQIDAQTPPNLALHLILDNYATHKHPKVNAWLAKHPRFHIHFVPTSSSWLNLVERFFRDLSQDVISPGSFGSVRELVDSIWAYLDQHNLQPSRYTWRADGQAILEKIARAREALAREQQVRQRISETLH